MSNIFNPTSSECWWNQESEKSKKQTYVLNPEWFDSGMENAVSDAVPETYILDEEPESINNPDQSIQTSLDVIENRLRLTVIENQLKCLELNQREIQSKLDDILELLKAGF